MDNDGDGFISVPEIVDFLTNFGDKMSADEVNSLIGSVARDNRGFVHCKGKDKIDSKIDTGCPNRHLKPTCRINGNISNRFYFFPDLCNVIMGNLS